MKTNQQIVDDVSDVLPDTLPGYVVEKILDCVFDVLNNHVGIDLPED
jgi:hypothetical protein